MKMRFLNVFMSLAVIWSALLLTAGCGGRVPRLTAEETQLIMSSDGLMRVLLVTSPEDSLVLRTPCVDLAEEDLQSEVYDRLARRIVATVTDSTQDGVGLAAPQVGLSRRVVAVMRYDKPGYPFEVYPNIHIEYFPTRSRPARKAVSPFQISPVTLSARSRWSSATPTRRLCRRSAIPWTATRQSSSSTKSTTSKVSCSRTG